jgi:hypothetical protein
VVRRAISVSVQTAIPRECPACATELYPISRLRPEPVLSPLARLLLTCGVTASAVIFLGAAVYYGFVLQVRPRKLGGVLGVIFLVPALVPGLTLAWIAYRLPKVLALRCPRCRWRGRYRVGHDGRAVAVDAFSMPAKTGQDRSPARDAAAAAITRMDGGPPPPPGAPAAATSGSDFCVVADDAPAPEAEAWAYAEVATGRTPEEVAAELVAAGWDPTQAEVVAEHARRATRHLRR